MVYLEQFKGFLRGLLNELDGVTGMTPPPTEPKEPRPQVSRVRFRLLRAQYNRKLFPQFYTDANPDGLYSGKELEKIRTGNGALNRESNAWFDFTAYDAEGLELQRDQLRRLGLGYTTILRVGNGFISGGGQNPDGTPKNWEKQNPDGANISEEAWRTSLGMNTRVHFSEEGSYEVDGELQGFQVGPITIRVS
jgi:hypothetical protein